MEGRQAGQPLEAKSLPLGPQRDRIGGELRPQRLGDAPRPPLLPGAAGGIVEARAGVRREGKAHGGIGHGEPFDHIGHGGGLGALGFQEFEPRRRRREEIARLDPRALGPIAGLDPALLAGLDPDLRADLGAGGARVDGEIGDGGDGGQRLAAKAERRDRGEIAIGDFRGGVALDGERQILGAHPASIVDDANEPPPARLYGDIDARGAGVERIFDELLHGGGRPLDHLAGGDAVDENGIETANAHEGSRRVDGAPAIYRRGAIR